MKKLLFPNLCLVAVAALTFGSLTSPIMLQAQSGSSPEQGSGAQGVSHPPPDDTIEASPDPVPSQGKPSPGSPAVSSTHVRPSYSLAAPSVPSVSPTDDPNSPDYGIVTAVPSSSAPESRSAYAPASGDARLVARPENPDYDIVSMVPSPSNQLAEGTDIRVRLMQGLSTDTTQGGSTFRAQVAADVYKEGRVVIPIGSELRGRVLSVTQGHRMGAPATMRLRPDTVLLPDGTAYHLYAQAIHTDAQGARTDAEGAIQPSSRVTKNLVELGAGSGGGAATGAIFGGPVGAAAGALVGAGIVTAHLLLQHPNQAHVEQGAEVTFSLTEPMDLLPTRN